VGVIVIVGIAAPKWGEMAIHNIGSIVMIKAFMPENPNLQGLNSSLTWFEIERRISIRIPEKSFIPTLISLAISDPVQCSECARSAVSATMKGTEVQQRAAIVLAARYVRIASQKGRREIEKAWRIIKAELQPKNAEEQELLAIWLAHEANDFTQAIAWYQSAMFLRGATWQDYLRVEILYMKAGNIVEAAEWHKKLIHQYSDRQYAALHDISNPHAQFSVAEAFAYFGFFEDAIAIDRKALASADWDWGHRQLANFYEKVGQYVEAEKHLRAAIERATNPELLKYYIKDLATLLIQEGKMNDAGLGILK
jgi:tetratricopeptide (TPR) repeat protein